MSQQLILSQTEPVQKCARVILRPDGSVHIAFTSRTSIRATARAISDLFKNPMRFMESGCLAYEETTKQICRAGQKAIPLEEIVGLDLAYLTKDRRIVCEFGELFFAIFDRMGKSNMDEPLDMSKILNNASKGGLADEKAILLRYYLDICAYLSEKKMPQIERHVHLCNEVQLAVMKVFLSGIAPSPQAAKAPAQPTIFDMMEEEPAASTANPEPAVAPKYLMGTKEYAALLNVTSQQVRNWCRSGALAFVTDKHGHLLIDKRTLPEGWKPRKKRSEETLAGSYEEVQRIIRETGYFTDRVGKFILSLPEMSLLASHREVFWNGRPALIIDIHPDYTTLDGVSNRERIMHDASPISPEDGEAYQIHHLGKRADAPFVILSKKVHTEQSGILHQAPTDKSMNRPEFDMQRISFWKTYLRFYDEYGFENIPYLNKPRKPD